MSDLESTGQEAPAVASEAAPPATTTEQTVVTPPDGTAPPEEDKEPVAPKTYSEEEVQERIERATAKAAAKAERRAFREASQIMQRQQQPVQQPVDDKPRRDQFASEDDFVDRLTDWKLDQRDKSANQQRQAAQETATNTKTESLYKEAAKLPGFDREAFEELPLTATMAHALVESDTSAKLMAYLTSNPDEVDRINVLSPVKQAAEMGKLETKLASAPTVKAPKAPAPISTVGNGNTKTVTNLNTSNMDDFKKQFKAAGSRWIR
jgi:hypothetical protein